MLLAQRLGQDEERQAWGEAYADHDLVFAREDGNPLAPETVTKRFRELVDEAELRPVRFHDLRHGRASLLLAADVDIALVSKMLGHSSIAITADTYSHLLGNVGRDAAEAADALIPRRPREQNVSNGGAGRSPAEVVNEVAPGQTRRDASGPPGDRTLNPRIKSPLLCRLS